MKGIQRKRTKGWRMPEGVISVTRPGRWGNPYTVHNVGPVWFVRRAGEEIPNTHRYSEAGALNIALDLFRSYAEQRLALEPTWLDPLRGHDLACWCDLNAPCHRDALIDLCKSYFGESSPK